MNIITLNKDVKRTTTLLNGHRKKALKQMFQTFTPGYIASIRSKLDPSCKYLFDNMFNN